MIVPDIEQGARWTVEENDKVGPRIIAWEPFPDRPQPDAVSQSGVFPPTAALPAGGEKPSPDEIDRPANDPL
jgi:hypothetical protein